MSSIFDAEQSRVVSVKSYVLSFTMYSIQYRMMCIFLWWGPYSNAGVEMDRSVISIKSIK